MSVLFLTQNQGYHERTSNWINFVLLSPRGWWPSSWFTASSVVESIHLVSEVLSSVERWWGCLSWETWGHLVGSHPDCITNPRHCCSLCFLLMRAREASAGKPLHAPRVCFLAPITSLLLSFWFLEFLTQHERNDLCHFVKMFLHWVSGQHKMLCKAFWPNLIMFICGISPWWQKELLCLNKGLKDWTSNLYSELVLH